MAAVELLATFERFDPVYKTVDSTPIGVAVLVPKTLASSGTPTTCPLMVHFHGGCLIIGTNPEPHFIGKWVLRFAEVTNAIIVSPAYRLIPEATGGDVMDDISDFWDFVSSSLPSVITQKYPHLEIDLSRTAAFGESAGGFLSLQSAFLFQSKANIKAVVAPYPAMYPDIACYNPRQLPEGVQTAQDDAITAYIQENARQGKVRLSTPFPELLELLVVNYLATGRHREMLGEDQRLRLEYGLQTAVEGGKGVPPIWILQSTEDRVIPKESTDELVQRISKALPDTPLKYSVQTGGDHGFDAPMGLDEPFIAEGIEFVKKYWPGVGEQ
ncbi:Alpha/Beta hydrolase protein [Apodospora peruviana]|uniref:Alpha/Beta hydrolase protein n=1 Tax=Apodospora peruviana TaxID=516989 RepID=A0AAE0I5S7_9PEZI|nr:Alpha/Beta hydrolase protein [Apodospora peruviana]